MNPLKKSLALLILLTSMIGSRAVAQQQDAFNLDAMVKFNKTLELKAARAAEIKQELAKEVMQDHEYAYTGSEKGILFSNLMVDGKPVDFGDFNLRTKGELTVSKGAAGQNMQIPFYVYLRRDGTHVLIPGKEIADSMQIKIELSEILKHAKPGDYLVIEAVKKEDGSAKSILKLLGPGC